MAAGPFSPRARPFAAAPENPGEHLGLPVDHVGVAVAALRDQPDVFRNRRVSRASPLAIDDFVKIVWLLNMGSFLSLLVLAPLTPLPSKGPARRSRRVHSSRWTAFIGADSARAPLR